MIMDKKENINLLDSWHAHINNAMQKVHEKFNSDSKFILTESDLKCWLFLYLQEEKPSVPFGVHSEVTHYAPHKIKIKKSGEFLVDIKRKHKFRDLSLLSPDKIKDNKKFLRSNKKLLSKGFSYNGPAIHFELKFVRVNNRNTGVTGLEADIKKIMSYTPKESKYIRDFVIVCGSRSENAKVKHFEKVVTNMDYTKLKCRVWFYLFDKANMLCSSYDKNGLIED